MAPSTLGPPSHDSRFRIHAGSRPLAHGSCPPPPALLTAHAATLRLLCLSLGSRPRPRPYSHGLTAPAHALAPLPSPPPHTPTLLLLACSASLLAHGLAWPPCFGLCAPGSLLLLSLDSRLPLPRPTAALSRLLFTAPTFLTAHGLSFSQPGPAPRLSHGTHTAPHTTILLIYSFRMAHGPCPARLFTLTSTTAHGPRPLAPTSHGLASRPRPSLALSLCYPSLFTPPLPHAWLAPRRPLSHTPMLATLSLPPSPVSARMLSRLPLRARIVCSAGLMLPLSPLLALLPLVPPLSGRARLSISLRAARPRTHHHGPSSALTLPCLRCYPSWP